MQCLCPCCQTLKGMQSPLRRALLAQPVCLFVALSVSTCVPAVFFSEVSQASLLLSAGINRRQGELTSAHQVSTSLLRAAPNTSGPLQAAKPEPPPASSRQTHSASAAMQMFSDDDEDAKLLIPLAFAAKPKSTPARHDRADPAPRNNGFNAAFGSNTGHAFTVPTQRASCYQSLASDLGCRDHTYAMADLESQSTSAPK